MAVLVSWISMVLLSSGVSATITPVKSAEVSLPKLTSDHQQALSDNNTDLVLSLTDFKLDGPVSGSWEVVLSKSDHANCPKDKSQTLGVFSTFDLSPQSKFSFALEPAIKNMDSSSFSVTIRPLSGLENPAGASEVAGSITVQSIEIRTVPRT